MPSPAPSSSACFLFDNGSLRAAPTLALRRVAAALAARLGETVRATSLLHSSNVPALDLEGVAAELLEPALKDFFAQAPAGEACLVPLFFGPGSALADYVPARVRSLRERFPQARVWLAPCLVQTAAGGDRRVAELFADAVRTRLRALGWKRPRVLLVDHGSPVRAVTAARDHLGSQLRALLGSEARDTGVASMERRAGPEFDFNEPLLATALRRPPFDDGETIVAPQFFFPGRHAGPGGDVARICAEAEAENPARKIQLAATIGSDPRLIGLLAERRAEAREL